MIQDSDTAAEYATVREYTQDDLPSVHELMGACQWYDRLTDALRLAGLHAQPSDTQDTYTEERLAQ